MRVTEKRRQACPQPLPWLCHGLEVAAMLTLGSWVCVWS